MVPIDIPEQSGLRWLKTAQDFQVLKGITFAAMSPDAETARVLGSSAQLIPDSMAVSVVAYGHYWSREARPWIDKGQGIRADFWRGKRLEG